MSEQFLTLMADLDDNSHALMSGWYEKCVIEIYHEGDMVFVTED